MPSAWCPPGLGSFLEKMGQHHETLVGNRRDDQADGIWDCRSPEEILQANRKRPCRKWRATCAFERNRLTVHDSPAGLSFIQLGFSTLISSVLAKTPMKMEPSPIWLHSGNSSFTNIPTDLSHLTNLKRLEINNSTWCLQLPNGIKDLYIGWTGYLETVFSPKDFKGSPQVVANLTTLYIFTDLRDQDSDIAEWITDIRGFWFIRHSFFPNLEKAGLALNSGEDNMTTRIDESSRLLPVIPYRTCWSSNLIPLVHGLPSPH